MPTSYTDQFWLIDPFSPPPSGSTLLVQTYDLIDADDDGDIGRSGRIEHGHPSMWHARRIDERRL